MGFFRRLAVDFIENGLEAAALAGSPKGPKTALIGALCLKISLVPSANKRAGTKLERGAFGLIVSASNEVHLFLPATADDDAVFPKNALVLLAVANRLRDSDWVDQLLVEEFGPVQSAH
jgi:hypothetical protein